MPTEELKRKVHAYIFLEIDLGKENDVTYQLFKFPEVKEVHEITGEKDLMVVLEVEHDILAALSPTRRIADFVRDKVSLINHIKNTETIIPVRTIIRS